MKYTKSSVQNLYAMTKANYDQIFDKHVKEFYKDIMAEAKKGYYEVILCPRDYEDQCNEPLRAVYDAVEHIRTLFKGIKIVENDDNPGQMCDGYYFDASWDLEVVKEAEAEEADARESVQKSVPVEVAVDKADAKKLSAYELSARALDVFDMDAYEDAHELHAHALNVHDMD
jgi:hypothetical protein